MARKLFISAGHTNIPGLDRGASGNGYIEGDLTVEFRDLLAKELKIVGVGFIADNNANALVQTIQYFRNLLGKEDITIDIHFNSGEPVRATGVEVLVPDNPSIFEAKLAKIICDSISFQLNIKNRGVKTENMSARGKLGFMRLVAENILIEVCFISNKSDMYAYHLYKEKTAKALAQILKYYIYV